jgi:hypothetical protein
LKINGKISSQNKAFQMNFQSIFRFVSIFNDLVLHARTYWWSRDRSADISLLGLVLFWCGLGWTYNLKKYILNRKSHLKHKFFLQK